MHNGILICSSVICTPKAEGSYLLGYFTDSELRWAAERWDHAMLTGNGRIGALVCGTQFLYREIINASIKLGRDADRRTHWKDILDNMSKYPLQKWGNLVRQKVIPGF